MQSQLAWNEPELHSALPNRAKLPAVQIRSDRAAIAMAALQKAEQQTGAVPVAPLVRDTSTQMSQKPAFTVPQQLRALLPGGLKRGSVVQVTGSTALMFEMLAVASAEEIWTAIVGQPHLGILAAAEAGVDLKRLVLVPTPGPDAVLALSALLDGVDILVVGPEVTLLPSDRRRLTARARERGTVIIATSPWPGAQVELDVTAVRWRGLGTGSGRLRYQEFRVERSGRGSAAQWAHVEMSLPSKMASENINDTAERCAPVELPDAAQLAPALRLVG